MNIGNFAELLESRIQLNFDSIIIVDSGGVKGTGKSVFSMQLAKLLCKLINYTFSFDLIVFNPDEARIIEMVKNLPEGCPILIDEASKVFYKRDFQKDYQKNLIKFINVCRKFRKIIILNNPDFWDLDKDLRNLADFRVVIVKRGLAQVRGKSPNPDLKDKWLRDFTSDKIEEYTKGDITKVEKVRLALKKIPNHLFDIPIADMDKEEYKRYEELSKREELKAFIEDKPTEYILLRMMAYMLSLYETETKPLATKLNNLFYQSSWAKDTTRPLISAEYLRIWIQEAEGRLRSNTSLNNNNI